MAIENLLHYIAQRAWMHHMLSCCGCTSPQLICSARVWESPLCEEMLGKCTGDCLGNVPCGEWCPDLRRVLGEMLPPVLSCFQPDIVLYDAGVDPHKDDSLGKLALTDEGLLRRELQVSQPRSLAAYVPCLVLDTRINLFYVTSCLSVSCSSLGFPLVPGRC